MSPLYRNLLFALWVTFSLTAVLHADEHAPNQQNSPPGEGALKANKYPGFAGYSRKITTDSAEAQQWFNQGIQLLYGYNHDEAIRSFEKATAVDPSCAMGWWGSAYARGLHINNPEMSENQSKLAHEAAQKGARGDR